MSGCCTTKANFAKAKARQKVQSACAEGWKCSRDFRVNHQKVPINGRKNAGSALLDADASEDGHAHKQILLSQQSLLSYDRKKSVAGIKPGKDRSIFVVR